MRKVGIVASGSSQSYAIVLLNAEEEKQVKAEDLVLVKNKAGNNILAVCRSGMGVNENLKAGTFSPGVAYARMGKSPSNAKEFYAFELSMLGDVRDDHLRDNRYIIAPSSDVEIFEDTDNPMHYLSSSTTKTPVTLGHYRDKPTWAIPIDPSFLCYHVGVFSSTGSGKSFLARYQLIPTLTRAGYDTIVFDWKGSDYVPHFKTALDFTKIALDEDTITSYLTSKMNYFGFYGEGKQRNSIRTALDEVIYEGTWRQHKIPEQLRQFLKNTVSEHIRAENLDRGGLVSSYGREYIRKFERHLAKLKDIDLRAVMGNLTVEEIVKLLRKENCVVVDLSLGGDEQKLSVFLSIGKHFQTLMEQKQDLKVALVIDEGPQYCPWSAEGIRRETTEMISRLCALGRSYHLAIVLLSQGMAGDIGINASVRRNLNTQFIGKLYPLDIPEALSLLGEQSRLKPEALVNMPEGHFYMTGKLSKSPVPIMMTFPVK